MLPKEVTVSEVVLRVATGEIQKSDYKLIV